MENVWKVFAAIAIACLLLHMLCHLDISSQFNLKGENFKKQIIATTGIFGIFDKYLPPLQGLYYCAPNIAADFCSYQEAQWIYVFNVFLLDD